MSTTIPHRELRNNSSEILRRVSEGEVFNVTNHGVVVAEIRSPQAPQDLAGVRFRPARVRAGFDQIPRTFSAESSKDIMDFLKGDR